jgi:DNA-binding Xre family transcriptional regulator
MNLKKIQNELKSLSRKKGLKYRDFALKLGLSEATVKRLFNFEDISFSKLEQLCSVLDVELFDVIEIIKNKEIEVYTFTVEQESALAEDTLHLYIFREILQGRKVKEIAEKFSLSESDLLKILKKFEKAKLTEVHPFGKIKVLAHFPYRWIPKGQLEKKYGNILLDRIKGQSLHIGLNHKTDEEVCIVFEWGLTEKSSRLFINELSTLYDKYRSYAELEIKDLDRSFVPTTGMISIGRYELWDKYDKNKKPS